MEININSRQTKDTVRGAPRLPADAQRLPVRRRAGHRPRRTPGRRRRNREAIPREGRRAQGEPSEEALGPEAELLPPHVQAGRGAGRARRQGALADLPDGQVRRQRARPGGDRLTSPGSSTCPMRVTRRRGSTSWTRSTSSPSYGPTTVERHDPLFPLSKTCCWWSGQSWPYATTQTLVGDGQPAQQLQAGRRHEGRLPQAADGLRQDAPQERQAVHRRGVSSRYRLVGGARLVQPQRALLPLRLLRSRHHRPRRAAAARRRHRSRSTRWRPDGWDYFALDDVRYRGHDVSILWDRTRQALRQAAPACRSSSTERRSPVPTKLQNADGRPPAGRRRRVAGTARQLRGQQRRPLLPPRSAPRTPIRKRRSTTSTTAITGITARRRTAGPARERRTPRTGCPSTSASTAASIP